MTTPRGSAPGGAFVLGTKFGQDITDASARQVMKAGTVGTAGSYANVQFAHNSEVRAPMRGQAGSIAGLDERVTYLEGGGTLTMYPGNATWTNPNVGSIEVIGTNGGQAGQDGHSGGTISIGGDHGGFLSKSFLCSSLPSTVLVTVGAGGATNAQGGGQSSFGTYVLPSSGQPGLIYTRTGIVASPSTPGVGGDGGNSNNAPGNNGDSTPQAAGGKSGGNSGSGINGLPGGSVPLDSITPCGGAGGGGGEYINAPFAAPGGGGAGGAPGGGGGAGGNHGGINFAATSAGAHGGAGRMWIIWRPDVTSV